MGAPKVVISNWVHPQIHESLEPHCALVANLTREPWSRERVIAECAGAVALMAFMPDRVDEELLARCPELRIVACALKGFDNFDIESCTRRGVWLTVTPDLLTAPAAELAVGLLIGIGRNIGPGDRCIRSEQFRGWCPVLYGAGLDGSVVGIFGAGQVGKAIAARLHGFGCRRILCHDPGAEDASLLPLGLEPVGFAELLGESDFLVLAAPLNASTQHCFDAQVLHRLKPECRLINIARGSLVDEEAVAQAIRSGTLAGYAADVFELEDWARTDRPQAITPGLLAQQDKTLFTPHLGSAVDSVRLAIARQAAESILQYLRGETPFGAVNKIR